MVGFAEEEEEAEFADAAGDGAQPEGPAPAFAFGEVAADDGSRDGPEEGRKPHDCYRETALFLDEQVADDAGVEGQGGVADAVEEAKGD